MKSVIAIVEIPVVDFARAVKFYNNVLDIGINEVDFGGMKLGIFPASEGTPTVHLVHGDGSRPSTEGTLVYLDGGPDLQIALNKVIPGGGTVMLPKTEIAPEMGFYAVFVDTEGNKLGLYSLK